MTEQSNELVVIWGAKGIARALGISKRKAFHLLDQKQLKGAKKIGGRWAITLEALAANFRQDVHQ